MKNPVKGLNVNVVLLGIVSFLTDLSSEMIFPLVPIFLTTVLGAPVAVVGLIEGIAEATANILKMLSGMYSDKIGRRKPFVLLGYGFSTITKPFFALATIWPHVLAVRFLDRVGKGLRASARDVIVADYTDEKTRGKAFGYRKMMDQFGAFGGPLLAFLLMPILLERFEVGMAYRVIFALSVIPAALAVFTLFFVKEKEDAVRNLKGWKLDFSVLNRQYKINLLVTLLFNLAVFNYAFLVLRAQDAGFSIAVIPLVYMFYNLVYGIFAVPAGVLSDKIGRKAVIVIGYLVFGLTSLALGLSTSAPGIWLSFGLYGVFMAIMESVQRAYISDLVPGEYRGTALGLYQGAMGFAALPASVIAGLLWEVHYAGVRMTFLYSAVVAVFAAALFMLLCRKECEEH
ncbi:MAG: MFS transporter [Candidatus Altiarchaeota archaeon]|nr:MFS transporter [Candidatus Altiarchaeota archaeon]